MNRKKVEKIKIRNAPTHITQGPQTTLVHAPLSEARFVQISAKASEIGMRLNAHKTQLLCISGKRKEVVSAFIHKIWAQ